MSLDRNDERLTAYVFGELGDDERAELEVELLANPDARAELEEIRHLLGDLEAVLTDPEAAGLRPEQKAALLQHPTAVPAVDPAVPAADPAVPAAAGLDAAELRSIRPPGSPWMKWAVAASIACVGVVGYVVSQQASSPGKAPADPFPASIQMETEFEMQEASIEASQFEPRVEAPAAKPAFPTVTPPPAGATAKPSLESVASADSATGRYWGQPAQPPLPRWNHGPTPGWNSGKRWDRGAPRWPNGVPGDAPTAGTEAYDPSRPTPPTADHRSTFSVDVDTASYANVRRILREGRLPPAGAVRVEEFVNAMQYGYAAPTGEHPISVAVDAAKSPWSRHRLVRIALRAAEVSADDRAPLNLVFLIDVSGSMASHNKLPLVTWALSQLTNNLRESDRVGIVVYAGASGVVLEPTSDPHAVRAALARLRAGGSTNGGAGIRVAYELARRNATPTSMNRVVLCTDGDFNVGVTSRGALEQLITREAATGVFLTVLGFGRGNLKDSQLEQLANRGNGVYGYVDTQNEARKLLVDGLTGTLITVAKDVKIQVTFNPVTVASHRLVGYDNRRLQHHEFDDDRKDAGEMGSGHTVTALYEVVTRQPAATGAELLTVAVRYKTPKGLVSKRLERAYVDADDVPDADFRRAAAVAAFAMRLRNDPWVAGLSWDRVLQLVRGAALPEVEALARTAAGLSGYRQ